MNTIELLRAFEKSVPFKVNVYIFLNDDHQIEARMRVMIKGQDYGNACILSREESEWSRQIEHNGERFTRYVRGGNEPKENDAIPAEYKEKLDSYMSGGMRE